jgi:hypothetical protein
LKHFHSDGGSELIAKEVLGFLHSNGATTTHSPRDTPQMNSVTERWVRSLKEKVMCMLLRSSLPLAFWWFAVQCACYLLNRVPTKTAFGYMTPYECLHNVAPDLKWLRIWGCKCYALKPIAERKKDFDDKAYSGFLVGYAEENTGYLVFVPELNKVIVSVHVVFNEIIPDSTSDYFAELDRLKIDVASEEKDPASYSHLVGTHHLDDEDGLVYETTRVVVRKGYIVAFRRLVTDSELKPREEATPIHIADIVRMTMDLRPPPSADSVLHAPRTPCDAPVTPRPGNVTIDNRRRIALNAPSPSVQIPGWNSEGRLATETPIDKRRRLSQGVSLRTSLNSEFALSQDSSKRGQRNRNTINSLFLLCLHMSCPQSYNEALKSPEYPKWRDSMNQEITSLRDKRGCWEVVRYPSRGKHTILRCHFVYKIKMKDGKVDRYKSRLVVDGSKQKSGIDYSESFAPVIRYTTLRIFLAICAVHHMSVHQLDVETAFIHAPLHEMVYVHPHPEMQVPKGHCIRLVKSLYGLKQSPRNWNQHLHTFIVSLCFERCALDHCLYVGTLDSVPVFAAIFVDDILIASSSDSVITKIKDSFKEKFTCSDMGLAREFLSIRITQSPGEILIDQTQYVTSLLEKYSKYVGKRNYSDVPTVTDYIRRNIEPTSSTQHAFVDNFPYAEIVGSLLYVAVVTRLDIMYAVSVLTRHLKHPTYDACKAACRVLNYLSNSRSKGIRYHGSKLCLHAYTDSDWGSDKDTRRSTSGTIVLMAGGPVNWMSKLQPIVALSSMEAEYIAAFFAVQDIVWILQLLRDIGLQRSRPIPVHIDNMSARQLAMNPVHHQRSKHIDIKYHWLRDQVAASRVVLIHTDTTDQRADFLTKSVSGVIFHKHVNCVMVDIVVA